jgi:hypothetical protein
VSAVYDDQALRAELAEAKATLQHTDQAVSALMTDLSQFKEKTTGDIDHGSYRIARLEYVARHYVSKIKVEAWKSVHESIQMMEKSLDGDNGADGQYMYKEGYKSALTYLRIIGASTAGLEADIKARRQEVMTQDQYNVLTGDDKKVWRSSDEKKMWYLKRVELDVLKKRFGNAVYPESDQELLTILSTLKPL